MFVLLGPKEYHMWKFGKHLFYFNYWTTSILTKKACFTFVSLLPLQRKQKHYIDMLDGVQNW